MPYVVLMIESFPLVLIGIGIIISILYLANIIKNLDKTHQRQLETSQTQFLMQLYNESYNNDSFIDAYVRLADLTINSYDEYLEVMEDDENKKASSKVAMFFEGIGLLAREDQINIRLFAQLMTGMTRSWWERLYKPILEEGRERRSLSNWMSESEYLYNELMKYHGKHSA